ncbi:hypothetical protein GCM10023195_60200 [Actinoallomurus liliacearum]|uniref:Uncharacterized protein n=1 Tax=Actinoallomurus liliacearum TaxID=1080073 RepID=A0ABP8TSC4_9ACTN
MIHRMPLRRGCARLGGRCAGRVGDRRGEPQTPATEARILRRERLRQPRQTPAEPRPTHSNVREAVKVLR